MSKKFEIGDLFVLEKGFLNPPPEITSATIGVVVVHLEEYYGDLVGLAIPSHGIKYFFEAFINERLKQGKDKLYKVKPHLDSE